MTKTLRLTLAVRDDDPSPAPVLSSFAARVDDAVLAIPAAAPAARVEEIGAAFAAAGIPLVLVRPPFRTAADFRNEALSAARELPGPDHFLLAEPGASLAVTDPDFRARIVAPVHAIRERGAASVLNPRIVARSAAVRWRGAAFAYLEVPAGAVPLAGVELLLAATTARPTEKAGEDAAALASALRSETDPMLRARYVFYLGRALMVLGDHAGARRRFLERAAMGHWAEEVYCARLYAARCGEATGLGDDVVIEEYARLHNDMPHRAEAMHGVATVCRRNRWWDRAFEVAVAGLEIERPADALFREDWIYDWGLADELAVAAYWTGRFAESMQICDILLSDERVPPRVRQRVARNRAFAADASFAVPAAG